MMIKTLHLCDSTLSSGFNQENPFQKSKNLLHNPHEKNILLFNSKDKLGFQNLRSHTRLQDCGKNRRNIIVYSVEPGSSPSGPPPNTIISWVVGLAIAIVIPFISQKWGPLLKSKIEGALQKVEDVAEAVEKVAEKVEEAAEDIADDLPVGGKLKEAVDFLEKIAERTADDAGAIDDFIDKVQEEQEKAEALVESIKDELKKHPEDLKEEKPNEDLKEEKPNDDGN